MNIKITSYYKKHKKSLFDYLSSNSLFRADKLLLRISEYIIKIKPNILCFKISKFLQAKINIWPTKIGNYFSIFLRLHFMVPIEEILLPEFS